MAPPAVVTPFLMTDPGYLFIAPLLTTPPTNTVVGSVFTDAWAAAWLPLGATEDGSKFSYQTNVSPILVAEFFDPIKIATVSRQGAFSFALSSWGLTNYRRAINGGVTALTATSGSGTTALYDVSPPTPGSEVRCMLGWESLDNTARLIINQCIQGGTVDTAFQKVPSNAAIPCTFNLEVPASGIPFKFSGAGATRA